MEVYVLPSEPPGYVKFPRDAIPYTVLERRGDVFTLGIPQCVELRLYYPAPIDGRNHFYLAQSYENLDMTKVVVRLPEDELVQTDFGSKVLVLICQLTLTREGFARKANAGEVVDIVEIISHEEAQIRFS